MQHFQWSHKLHDVIAAAFGAGAFATVSLVTVETWVRISVAVLTGVFLILGIAMRTERFVRRMSRVFYGQPFDSKEEKREDESED